MAANQLAVLKSTLNAPSVQEQFKNALGAHKDAFVASIIDLYNGDKQLQTCDSNKVICEALKAAVLKLPINKALGFAYIVVYNNSVKRVDAQGHPVLDHGRQIWDKVPTPTFLLGYRGYIQLAMRTGYYRTINADLVYEGELQGSSKLTGEINLDGKKTSDKVIGYFCYFELLNGFSKTLYVPVAEMAAYAKKYSPSVRKETTAQQLEALANTPVTSKSVGWEGNFNDMALKTCTRRLLSKYGYLSVEMQSSIEQDYQVDQAQNAELVEESATKKIDLSEQDYQEVDAETGEVSEAPKVVTPAKDEEEPDF